MKKINLFFVLAICLTLLANQSFGDVQIKPKEPVKAIIGVHLMNIFGLDMTTNSFYGDFYLWCKWKGELDPLTNLEFVNSIDKWGFTKELMYDSNIVLEDGYNYNVMHCEGRFFYSFKLDRYPLDKQAIGIQVENSVYNTNELQYIIDENNSGMQDFTVTGWKTGYFFMKEFDHLYKTNFGMQANNSEEKYSNITFGVELNRPKEYMIWKLLLPLIIVLISSLGAGIIFPGYIDARIYAPIGALLTAVFLQQSYTGSLPEISYLILMDKIYVVAYLVIIAGIIQAIITANIVKDEEEAQFAKVRKIDKIFLAISLAFFLITSSILILTT